MVMPLREGRGDIADAYRAILTNAANLSTHQITDETAARAAQLRSKYRWLRTPDALQIATAMEHGADLIITNDHGWKRVSELAVVVLKDYLAAAP